MTRRLALSAAFCSLFLSLAAHAQQIELSNQIWSAELIRTKGQPVIPLFDGWFPNDDGSRTICFGFFNMNTQEALNVPVGESNYLETDYPGLDLSWRSAAHTFRSPASSVPSCLLCLQHQRASRL